MTSIAPSLDIEAQSQRTETYIPDDDDPFPAFTVTLSRQCTEESLSERGLREWEESKEKSNANPPPRQLQPRTPKQRAQVLKALGVGNADEGTSEISVTERQQSLYRKAEELHKSGQASSIRFEKLAMLCMLHCQHDLVKMDEQLSLSNGVFERSGQLQDLKVLLRDYHDSIWLLKDMWELDRPSVEATRKFGTEFARELHEPQYWVCADALNLFDLSSKRKESGPDGLRRILQNHIPEKFLDNEGVQRRQTRYASKQDNVGAGTAKIIRALKKQPIYISPFVDKFSRATIAILGATFLLLPVIFMTVFHTTTAQNVIVTVAFTISFCVIMAFSTEATNQEVLAAAAGYTAVLVVFIGASIGMRT